MKDEILKYIFRGIEILGGILLLVFSFLGKNLWSDYKDLKKEVADLKQKVDDLGDNQDKAGIVMTGRHEQLINRIKTVENYTKNKVDRIEELTNLKFEEIHRDLDSIKEGQKETNSLLTELLKR